MGQFLKAFSCTTAAEVQSYPLLFWLYLRDKIFYHKMSLFMTIDPPYPLPNYGGVITVIFFEKIIFRGAREKKIYICSRPWFPELWEGRGESLKSHTFLKGTFLAKPLAIGVPIINKKSYETLSVECIKVWLNL